MVATPWQIMHSPLPALPYRQKVTLPSYIPMEKQDTRLS